MATVLQSTPTGSGSPEGVVGARPGQSYRDRDTGWEYLKLSGTGNTGWAIRANVGTTVAITAARTMTVADYGINLEITANSFTQALPAPATVWTGWWFFFINRGSGIITIDGNGANIVTSAGSASTRNVREGVSGMIRYNGTTWTFYEITPPGTFAVTGAGTAYALTASSAQVDMGTTDPLLSFTQRGTFLIQGWANVRYNGATFAANRSVELKLRRTNNTAADVTGAIVTLTTDITTTVTETFAAVSLPPVSYTTAGNNDTVGLFGSIDVVPSAGSLDVIAAQITAIRIA